jgi:hypothetical protein
MKSKGCGSLHESQTLECRLKKYFRKVCRIGGSFAELLAVIQRATFCRAMPIKKQALFFLLKYGLFQTTKYMESFFVRSG